MDVVRAFLGPHHNQDEEHVILTLHSGRIYNHLG